MMFREMMRSRLILGGITFFVLVVVGSQLYSWHVRRSVTSETERMEHAVDTFDDKKPPRISGDAGVSPPVIENRMSVAGAQGDSSNTEANSPAPVPEKKIRVDIQSEILAEEERALSAQSAEEARLRELKQHQADLFTQIRALIARSQAATSASANREITQQILQRQKQVLAIQQEIEGVPEVDGMAVVKFALMVNSGLNEDGEMPVSEYIKIADYIASEGSLETANKMRVVIQQAINNGDSVIKPEHIEVLR